MICCPILLIWWKGRAAYAVFLVCIFLSTFHITLSPNSNLADNAMASGVQGAVAVSIDCNLLLWREFGFWRQAAQNTRMGLAWHAASGACRASGCSSSACVLRWAAHHSAQWRTSKREQHVTMLPCFSNSGGRAGLLLRKRAVNRYAMYPEYELLGPSLAQYAGAIVCLDSWCLPLVPCWQLSC